jgi:hypothetical protein
MSCICYENTVLYTRESTVSRDLVANPVLSAFIHTADFAIVIYYRRIQSFEHDMPCDSLSHGTEVPDIFLTNWYTAAIQGILDFVLKLWNLHVFNTY